MRSTKKEPLLARLLSSAADPKREAEYQETLEKVLESMPNQASSPSSESVTVPAGHLPSFATYITPSSYGRRSSAPDMQEFENLLHDVDISTPDGLAIKTCLEHIPRFISQKYDQMHHAVHKHDEAIEWAQTTLALIIAAMEHSAEQHQLHLVKTIEVLEKIQIASSAIALILAEL